MNENLAYDYEIREELIDGQPMAMSPRPVVNHTRISGRIHSIFDTHLRGKPCEALADGVDLFLTEKDHFVPDMMVVCDKDKIKSDGVHGAPSLVVEVLSHSTAKRDRGYKKTAYEAAGVKEYWIVSPSECSIEVNVLEDGRYRVEGFYSIYPEEELNRMSEEEKKIIPLSFRCHILNDLIISLDDVFWFLI